jgi:hypothetical protein
VTVLAGCDLVFPPGKLTADADTSHPDADPLEPDADPSQPDAAVDAEITADANTCAMECLGDPATTGTAACASTARDWCGDSQLDTLDSIDLCSCSVGVPALYVFDVDLPTSAMKVAFLPASPSVTYYLSVDGAGCFAPDLSCQIDVICGTPGSILTYVHAVPSGASETLRLWSDDACSLEQVALFVWNP